MLLGTTLKMFLVVTMQKARERYMRMSEEKKMKLNAKKRENYHRRKAETQATDVTMQNPNASSVIAATNQTPLSVLSQGVELDDAGGDWLRRNDTYAATARSKLKS
ncbi:hypothetical protein SETIT_2G160900v2, partial [Setaria italica]